jgi:hypothetical protein
MFLDCISGAFDFLDKRFLWIIFHSEEENNWYNSNWNLEFYLSPWSKI